MSTERSNSQVDECLVLFPTAKAKNMIYYTRIAMIKIFIRDAKKQIIWNLEFQIKIILDWFLYIYSLQKKNLKSLKNITPTQIHCHERDAQINHLNK